MPVRKQVRDGEVETRERQYQPSRLGGAAVAGMPPFGFLDARGADSIAPQLLGTSAHQRTE